MSTACVGEGAVRRDDGHARFGEQSLGVQVGQQRRLSDHGGVDLALVETGGAVIDTQQFQRDLRVDLPPPPEQGCGVRAERGPRVSEAQRPRRGPGRVEGLVDGGQRGAGPVAEHLPRGSELQVVGAALNQAHTQMRLQLLQRPRQRGWVRCSRAAARVRLPSSAIATNTRRWRSSAVMPAEHNRG